MIRTAKSVSRFLRLLSLFVLTRSLCSFTRLSDSFCTASAEETYLAISHGLADARDGGKRNRIRPRSLLSPFHSLRLTWSRKFYTLTRLGPDLFLLTVPEVSVLRLARLRPMPSSHETLSQTTPSASRLPFLQLPLSTPSLPPSFLPRIILVCLDKQNGAPILKSPCCSWLAWERGEYEEGIERERELG